MPNAMTHRDEILGDVNYDPLAVALIDTPAMQRLGRLHQLGYAHLVYRGGNHTRLSHVLGAYGTAARLVAALHHNYTRRHPYPKGAIDPEHFLPAARTESVQPGDAAQLWKQPESSTQKRQNPEPDLGKRWEVLRHLVSWAALLHDIGHIPYGHTLEDEYNEFYEKHDSYSSERLWGLWVNPKGQPKSAVREVFDDKTLYPPEFKDLGIGTEDVFDAVLLICMYKQNLAQIPQSKTFVGRLENSSGKLAKRLLKTYRRLSGSLFHPYMTDIVANTISADYLDYLRRDPHNLGLDVLRDDRVVSRFWVGENAARDFRMALSLQDDRGKRRLDTSTGVVELVRQRYRFAEIVYYHKTKIAASAMLAKVFQLLGPPPDPAPSRQPLEIGAAADAVSTLIEATNGEKNAELHKLRGRCLPETLLDPAVGDDSLHLYLLHDAWTKFERAVRDGDSPVAEACYRSISLIQALCERRLYKLAFSLDSRQLEEIVKHREREEHSDIEAELTRLIEHLKGGEDVPPLEGRRNREMLERAMEVEAGWPEGSVIIYVSPRRSQAKGIETGALAGTKTLTLGRHPDVKGDVESLNRAYLRLWKLVVIVHPERVGEVVALSKAVDELARRLLKVDPGADASAGDLADACWLGYVRPQHRAAVPRFQQLNPKGAPLHFLQMYEELVEARPEETELANGATFVKLLFDGMREDAARGVIKEHFKTPHALNAKVEALRPTAAKDSRDKIAEIEQTQRILTKLAEEFRAR